MRIGIDARMYGPKVGGGGLGRYVEQLVLELQKIDKRHRFLLFLKKENFDSCRITNTRFEKRLADVHWYTLEEQRRMPDLIDSEKLDLIHYPHWNVPLFAKTPFVVTIHDLILLEQPYSAHATTRSPVHFAAKYAAFKKVLRHALEKSRSVIAVSEYTKTAIEKFFPDIPENKIRVIYEGLTKLPHPSAYTESANAPLSPLPPTPYLLYVGNAYPHKNLSRLIEAFALFHGKHPDIHLVLAGRNDLFYEKHKQEIKTIIEEEKRGKGANEIGWADAIHFVMDPSDVELSSLYHHARLFVFPSVSEGFGLPPLEAMSARIPVVSSHATCLPEILGDAVLFFDPLDILDLLGKLEQGTSDGVVREMLIEKGLEQIKKYSWEKMAGEVVKVYENF